MEGLQVRTLADVEACREQEGVQIIAGIRAHIVNFEARNAFPKKFMYKGCAKTTGPGRFCCISVEKTPCKLHDPTGLNVGNMFRFDLLLCDGSLGGKPTKVTIFDAAGEFLQMSTQAMALLDELQQIRWVQTQVLEHPLCEMTLRVANRSIVIQSFTWMERVVRSLSSPVINTPSRNLSCTESSNGRQQAMAAKGKSMVNVGTPSSVKDAGTPIRKKKLSVALQQKEVNINLKLHLLDLAGSSDDDE